MGRDKQQASAGHHGEAFWKSQQAGDNFGVKMMERMGWEQGGGLGKDGKGSAQFVKAKQKKDNAGVISPPTPVSLCVVLCLSVRVVCV